MGKPYKNPGTEGKTSYNYAALLKLHQTYGRKEPGNQQVNMTIDWDDISYVISSRYRIAVLQELSNGPATPSQIAENSDIAIAHISRALRGLREKTLVQLLVSEDRKKGRVYGITDKGETVWQKIEGENLV